MPRKILSFFCFLFILVLTLPFFSYAAGTILTDDGLDRVVVGATLSAEDITKLVSKILSSSLSVLEQGQTGLSTISNVNALNSAVVIQTNILFTVSTAENISQINTATVINNTKTQ